MKQARLDITPFCDKHNRMPEADRVALWVFHVEGDTVSLWGTQAEVTSAASLYAHANAMEEATFVLVDHRPVPRQVLSMCRLAN